MDNLIQFLGRLHPLIVHLPIGFLMITVGLHWLIGRGKYPEARELLPVLWLISSLSAVVACLAGYLLSLSGGYNEKALNIHRYLGIGLSLLSGIVYILLRQGVSARLQMSGVLVVALALFATGHFGGNLTHGEEYLTQPLYAMIGRTPAKPLRQPITNIEDALVYQDLVEPILEQKCWQCHSSQKQKGALRLDAEEFLLKGGKHGPVLSAGDKNGLYKRIILPEGSDERMPPKGKTPLDEREIQLIHWWITKGGGDFKKKVVEVPKDNEIKTILAGLGNGNHSESGDSKTVSEIPTANVPKPNQADKRKLESIGVAFTPLTPDHRYLAVNLVNTSNFTDEQMSLLLKLREQIVWLDMSGTNITDKSLPQIAQFKQLTRLSLDNTRITDAGIGHLKALSGLRYLNLYATPVTDQGLKALESCKGLKALYLWQTQVTPGGVAALQQAIGEGIEINYGIRSDNRNSL